VLWHSVNWQSGMRLTTRCASEELVRRVTLPNTRQTGQAGRRRLGSRLKFRSQGVSYRSFLIFGLSSFCPCCGSWGRTRPIACQERPAMSRSKSILSTLVLLVGVVALLGMSVHALRVWQAQDAVDGELDRGERVVAAAADKPVRLWHEAPSSKPILAAQSPRRQTLLPRSLAKMTKPAPALPGC